MFKLLQTIVSRSLMYTSGGLNFYSHGRVLDLVHYLGSGAKSCIPPSSFAMRYIQGVIFVPRGIYLSVYGSSHATKYKSEVLFVFHGISLHCCAVLEARYWLCVRKTVLQA